jgi:curved DNA-binding protein CbpA
VLGFPVGSPTPTKKEVTAQFRLQMRLVHPDHGGDTTDAAKAVRDLAEARRILTDAASQR